MKCEEAIQKDAVPIGIAEGGTVSHTIQKGEVFTYASFEPDRSTFVYKLRELQNDLVKRKVLL
jgi:predicted homoserine dehydrogenase-like protein